MTQANGTEGLMGTHLAQLSGLSPNGRVLNALALRGNVVDMIEAAETAALRPKDPGGISHSLRAVIACRASRLSGHKGLAAHFETGVAAQDKPLCDPANPGDTDLMRAILAFTDLVTTTPRDTQAQDIQALQKAGVSDADIVRLCELVAFLAFQYRVIAGLSLMEQTA